MEYYRVNTSVIKGSNYGEVIKAAYSIFHQVERRTKRNPYIRSRFFHKEKIFLQSFFDHIKQKNPKDRRRRLRFFPCSLELLQKTTCEPSSFVVGNSSSRSIIKYYRFYGITKEGEKFIVQVKQNKKKEKYLLSIFPEK